MGTLWVHTGTLRYTGLRRKFRSIKVYGLYPGFLYVPGIMLIKV